MPRSFTAAHQITNPGSPFNTFIVASPTVTTRRQVEMIPHQDPRMHPPPVTRARLSESVKKSLSVIIILENDLSPVTARHHMINRTGVLESGRSGHLPVYQAQRDSARSCGSVILLTPSTETLPLSQFLARVCCNSGQYLRLWWKSVASACSLNSSRLPIFDISTSLTSAGLAKKNSFRRFI